MKFIKIIVAMEFSWALQHQVNDHNGRNHPENHHEDINIINQVSARRLLSVTGKKNKEYQYIICVSEEVLLLFYKCSLFRILVIQKLISYFL